MAGVSNDHRDRPLVAVTGLGVVSNLGIGLDDSWAALKDGKSGIRTLSRFPTEALKQESVRRFGEVRVLSATDR